MGPRLVATTACAALVAAVVWLGWPWGAGVGVPSGEGRSGPQAPAAHSAETVFPWDRVSVQEPGADAAPAPHPVVPAPPWGAALSLPDPPQRPVWEMLRDYAGPRADQPQADAAMLAALVWCDRARSVPQRLWEARSQGAAPSDSARLEHTHDQAVTLCARLGAADYRVAVDILRAHARAGDPEARLYFSAVGPTGSLADLGHADTVPMSEAELDAWGRETLAYLRHPPASHRSHAYSTLAHLLDLRPPYPSGVVFGDRTRDPVEAHAYRLLWLGTLRQVPAAVLEMVRRDAAHLTPAQIAAAYDRARAIAAEDGATVPPAPAARKAPAQ